MDEPPDLVQPVPVKASGRWSLLWLWIGAHVVALSIVFAASGVFLVLGLTTSFGGVAGTALAGALFIVLAGGVLGFLQWMVVRRELAIGRGWVVATLLALAISLPAAFLLRWPLLNALLAPAGLASADLSGGGFVHSAAIAMLLVGLTLGVAQWLLLRPLVRRAGWWIPANGLALPLSLPAVYLLGLPFGLVTGLVLIWILRGQRAG